MPIIIEYKNQNVRPDIVEGESWSKLDSDSPRLGTINLRDLETGDRIIVNKDAIAKVREITDAAWKLRLAVEKEKAEKAQAREHAERANAEFKAQPLYRRIFRKCPYTLPEDGRPIPRDHGTRPVGGPPKPTPPPPGPQKEH